MAGVPLRQIQEWLGHSTIMMTMRYAHLAPDGGRELLTKVLDHQPKVRGYGKLTANQLPDLSDGQ
jgi:integrase